VICIAPSIGAATQEMLRDAGVTVAGPAAVSAGSPDTVHLVFEHSPGLVPLADGIVPRNNRFIVSPLHDPRTIILDDEMAGKFREAASSCNRAFLSGYQYLISDEEYRIAADQLRMVKAQNPHLRIHAEWVTVADDAITGRFIRHILPCVDSLGLNERELGFLCHRLDPSVSAHAGQAPLSAASLARQAIAICRAAGLVRLHLHTFGYYVVIFRDPHDPEGTRNALLFAARTVAQASPGEEPVIVPGGYQALEDAAGAFGRELSPGIFRNGEYHVIVIPSLIARGVTRTAGMGDRISSLAFAADPF